MFVRPIHREIGEIGEVSTTKITKITKTIAFGRSNALTILMILRDLVNFVVSQYFLPDLPDLPVN